MKIISKSQWVHVECYGLDFLWKEDSTAGFSFPCTKDGQLLMEEIRPSACENLVKCLSGEYAVIAQGVRDYSYNYFEHAQGQCSCGEIVDLLGFTNECKCGLLYNSFGQLLAPRSQWEETW